MTIFPNERTGGQPTSYSTLLFADSPTSNELSSAIKSVVVRFPAEYGIGPAVYNCFQEVSSRVGTTGGYLASNVVFIDTSITGFPSSLTLEIGPIVNPSIETGPLAFTVEFVVFLKVRGVLPAEAGLYFNQRQSISTRTF